MKQHINIYSSTTGEVFYSEIMPCCCPARYSLCHHGNKIKDNTKKKNRGYDHSFFSSKRKSIR